MAQKKKEEKKDNPDYTIHGVPLHAKKEEHEGVPSLVLLAEQKSLLDDLDSWANPLGEIAAKEGKRVVLRDTAGDRMWVDPQTEDTPEVVKVEQPEGELPVEDPGKFPEPQQSQFESTPEYEVAQALYWCLQHNAQITIVQQQGDEGMYPVVQIQLDWFAANPNVPDAGQITVQRTHFLLAVKAAQSYLQAINYGANTVI